MYEQAKHAGGYLVEKFRTRDRNKTRWVWIDLSVWKQYLNHSFSGLPHLTSCKVNIIEAVLSQQPTAPITLQQAVAPAEEQPRAAMRPVSQNNYIYRTSWKLFTFKVIIGRGHRLFHYKKQKEDPAVRHLEYSIEQLVLLDCTYLGDAYKTWPHVGRVWILFSFHTPCVSDFF